MDRINHLQQIVQESASRSGDDPKISATRAVLSGEGITDPLRPGSISSPSTSRTRKSSSTNPLMQSWHRATTMTISDIIPYVKAAPATHKINGLQWYKHRTRVKHEFVILEVERAEYNNLWLRIDRRAHIETTSVQILSSNAQPVDLVQMCDFPERFFNINAPDRSNIDCKLVTVFKHPPPLHKLGVLLSILLQESPHYTLHSDNCYFYCVAIYENLVELAEGEHISYGAPIKFSMKFARDVRANIRKRMEASNLATVIYRHLHQKS